MKASRNSDEGAGGTGSCFDFQKRSEQWRVFMGLCVGAALAMPMDIDGDVRVASI